MISAIIPAAGQSKRMGKPKMLLPWRNATIIEHVISVFGQAGVEDILVVTGSAQQQVEEIVSSYKKRYPVRYVHNRNYMNTEMLSSIQCGLQALKTSHTYQTIGKSAVLIGLGDQPHVKERSVRLILDAYTQTEKPLVVPSYRMRRGHPWLMTDALWNEFLELSPAQTPRFFLNSHANDIHYVDVDDPSILADLDTPEEYASALKDS
jgi:molybdenum cofactor cytidylyltransferase